MEVDARGLVVVLAAADGDAQHEPAAREVVDVAACLATSAPLARYGAIRIVVASRIRSVTAAAAASAISGS